MYHSLKNDAIFIADSHLNKKNLEFQVFLEKLDSKEITTTQLILMGDIFDFISGESKYFIKLYEKSINLLNKLSKNIEIIYLEGNHDYNLQKLFPLIKVYKIEQQPIKMNFNNKIISLAHGDNFVGGAYKVYTKVIRNHPLLVFLNALDFNHIISKKIEQALLKKTICRDFIGFEKFSLQRLNNYKDEIVIEGHYHQGKEVKNNNQRYINIPSLCCQKQYIKLNNNSFEKISFNFEKEIN
ncbi:MAG: metallophosphoesterase [Sulfurovum sp.]|jgi:UDP-2,3-diacylglucosamine hydrolase